MVRQYQRRSNRQYSPYSKILEALREVRKGDKSLRSVAKDFSIHPSTLSYHNKKNQDVDLDDEDVEMERINYQVLSKNIEQELVSYLLHSAESYVGLNPPEVRKLAYELAIANNLKLPSSWSNKLIAGPDWFTSFMKRNPALSIRVPEATSLARVASFNKIVVEQFFSNYKKVLDKYHFTSKDIFNMDESGLNTVHKPHKIVASRGKKQIGAVTSSERGEQITFAATVSAAGITLPPFFIFPRVRFHKGMIDGAPTDSVGVANKSGWMIKETFLEYLEHFCNNSRCSKEKPVLLLLDNHSSHISLNSVKYAKENGIVMLTFPPHCTHKLQPLDRSIFGPLKAALNKVQSEWMISNSGRTMKISDIPALVNQIYTQVFTEKNIQNGFKVTGIYPLNSSVFKESDYAANKIVQPQNNEIEIDLEKSDTSLIITLPVELRPLPSVIMSQNVRTNKRKGSTIILTDSEEMVEIEQKELNQQKNLKKKSNKTPLKKIENNVLKKVNDSANQKSEDSKELINKRHSLKRKLNNDTKQNLKKAKANEDNIISKENINVQEKLGQKHILKIVKSEKETLQEPSSSSTLKRIKINKNSIEEKIKIVKEVNSGAISNKRECKLSTKLFGYVLD